MFNQVINNSDIRREELDGSEYVVAPVTLLKPMYLNVPGNWSVNEAYLPEQEAKASIPSWNGTPLTLNHPTQNGAGTTANSPEMHEKTVLGRVFNAEWENGEVVGEAWFNVGKIREMGGMAENALERVLNGDSVEVSTGYRASKLPSGEYDGSTHNAVQGNLKPDHLAVLPNQQGKCSIEAGCGVGEPVANSLIVTNADMIGNQEFDYALTDVTPDDVDSYTDEEWDSGDVEAALPNPSESDENADVLDQVYLLHPTNEDNRDSKANWKLPFRSGPDAPVNTRALVTAKTGRGIPALDNVSEADKEGARERIEDFLSDAPDEMFGAAEEDMSENLFERAINALASLGRNSATNNAGGNSGVDDTTSNMSEKTQELVDNHGFKADNLPDEETDCFEAIYNRFVGEDDSTETETDTETTENVKEITESELEELISNRVDERLEQRQAESEKEQLASEIVGNSDEYDSTEAVLEDYPTQKALETKKNDVLGGQPDFSGAVGANAQPATNTEDADDLTMFGSDA